MSAPPSSHRVAAVRLAGGARTETTYALSLRPSPHGPRVRLGGAPPPAEALAEAAERTFQRLRDALPPSRRDTLEVEAGVVERRTPRSAVRRRYLLALAGGRILHLADVRREPGTPWRGEAEMDSAAAALPVVLGASAVLTLVEHLAEAAGGGLRRTGQGILPPLLRVSRAARSPYPPHDAGAGGEALAALAVRPELWGTPFGALPSDELGTLSVHARARAVRPACAAVIDAVLPVTGDACSAEWEAALGLVGEGGTIAVAPATVRLRLEAARLLAGAVGAVGPSAPALRRDPFRGDRYGVAPPLLTRARLGALREGAG